MNAIQNLKIILRMNSLARKTDFMLFASSVLCVVYYLQFFDGPYFDECISILAFRYPSIETFLQIWTKILL